jgi:hypothetical protein
VTVPGQELETEEVVNPLETGNPDFDLLVEQWVPLTLLVNSLNRSLGQEDAYPFALSAGALEKLRYVHDVISATHSQTASQGADPMQGKEAVPAAASSAA